MPAKPVRILFDTDLGGDCDDAGTLAMLHRLCDRGEAELLAVTHCWNSPYVAGCIDAINRFHGRTVPIGVNRTGRAIGRGNHAGALCEQFENSYPPDAYDSPDGPPDTLAIMRRTLADAGDGSVTLVVTGKLNSMARLLASGPNDVSPLSGRELIARKIDRTVVMGGRFFETWPMVIYPDGNPRGDPVLCEWNIKGDGPAAQAVCRDWPGELVFSSYEIGSYIHTMRGYPDRAAPEDPVALAYRIHNGGAGRCSWDQTAMLEAVRPGQYWHYHAYGRITVDDAWVTHWHADPDGRHTYLMPKADYETVRRVIDDLMDGR